MHFTIVPTNIQRLWDSIQWQDILPTHQSQCKNQHTSSYSQQTNDKLPVSCSLISMTSTIKYFWNWKENQRATTHGKLDQLSCLLQFLLSSLKFNINIPFFSDYKRATIVIPFYTNTQYNNKTRYNNKMIGKYP